MKYLITVILSVLALTANAQPRYHHGGHRHHSSNNWVWVAPAVIAGAIMGQHVPILLRRHLLWYISLHYRHRRMAIVMSKF